MEVDEEDTSHVSKPSSQSEYETVPMPVSHDETRDIEPQCDSEPTSESVKARLSGCDSSSSQPQQPPLLAIEGIDDVGLIEGEKRKTGTYEREEVIVEESVAAEHEVVHADTEDEAVVDNKTDDVTPIDDIGVYERAVVDASKEAGFSPVNGMVVGREASNAGGSMESIGVFFSTEGIGLVEDTCIDSSHDVEEMELVAGKDVSSPEETELVPEEKDVTDVVTHVIQARAELAVEDTDVALSSAEDAVAAVGQMDVAYSVKDAELVAATKEDVITSGDARGVVAQDIDLAASFNHVELAEEEKDVTEEKVKDLEFKEEGMSELKEDTDIVKMAGEVEVKGELEFRENRGADLKGTDVIGEVGVAEKQGVTGMVEEREVIDQVEEMEDLDMDMVDSVDGVVRQVEGLEAEENKVEALEADGDKEEALEADEDIEEDDDHMTGITKEKMESGVDDEVEEADLREGTMEVEEADLREGTMEVEETEPATGKRKRGKNLKASVRVPSRKKGEEDVCFICFDGGELVLCDRRGCPKAYHPACVNRDEAFFRSRGRWNCGWHLCSNCEKSAHYMCYTCTFSLCKACIKDAVILCVRGSKGFCETCMKTILLIEKSELGNKDKDQIDFNDRSSWEYLFKDYWLDLKERLSLTLDEISQAKNPWKGSEHHVYKSDLPDEPSDGNNDKRSDSDDSSARLEHSDSKRRKTRRRLKSCVRDKDSPSRIAMTNADGSSVDDLSGWASKELLEFVMHMRNGDKLAISQFDVQALLLEYIKINKLRDPRRKSQIICDSRLENLFGKPRVGHFEMLKLLESHFLIKDDSMADNFQGSVVDTETQLETEGSANALARSGKDKKRKTRKKGDERGLQSNLDDYAAIDMHNINLIYLRRNLLEDLLEDSEGFHDKVVGSFVRIRISGSAQKQDLYRLVQVVGTCKASEPYKVGKRMTDILLEILNLNKTEIVSIDIISNQEFTEDECKRLRQSIKCGLISRLSVGDIQEKVMEFQAVRVKDWLDTEIIRLNHLRDRASDLGKRKQLRECVEKIQLLRTPEERQRRLADLPKIHADPNMDPNYESEEDEDEIDDKRQENFTKPRGSGFGRRGKEPISPHKGGSALSDLCSGSKNYSNMNRESSRSRGFSIKGEDSIGVGEMLIDSWNHGRERELQQQKEKQTVLSLEIGSGSTHSVAAPELFLSTVSENSPTRLSSGAAPSAAKINEMEKIWQYQDPSGKVQGPFSITQLRKWSTTGYFPSDLKIWRTTEKQDDAMFLTDALTGKFQKDLESVDNGFPKEQMLQNAHPSSSRSGTPHRVSLQRGAEAQGGLASWNSRNEINHSPQKTAAPSVEVPKYSSDGWGSTNLPSPTPSQNPLASTRVQSYESMWSSNSVQPAGSHLQAPDVTPAPESEKILGSTNSQMHTLSTLTGNVLNNAGADMKNVVSNLQNLVQSMTRNKIATETQGWGSTSFKNPEMVASCPMPGSEPQKWGGAPCIKVETNYPTMMPAQSPQLAVHNSISTLDTGNGGVSFPVSGFSTMAPSNPWRPPYSTNQSNTQSPAPPNQPWAMSVSDQSQSAAPKLEQDTQNSSWGPVAGNPNMGWGALVPVNANINRSASSQGPAPGNANQGWVAPSPGTPLGNMVSKWAPPSQGPAPVNGNQGWVAHGQDLPQGNPNPSWATGSLVRESERSNNADRYSNQRDWGPHGGDSGYGGGKGWNRQSSFNSGGGGSSSRRRVCKYYESGHCKKGASCDYLHS